MITFYSNIRLVLCCKLPAELIGEMPPFSLVLYTEMWWNWKLLHLCLGKSNTYLQIRFLAFLGVVLYHVTGHETTEVVISQGPMKDSISHFWLMIWQQKCPGVVMLNKLVEEGKVSEKQARNVSVFCINV